MRTLSVSSDRRWMTSLSALLFIGSCAHDPPRATFPSRTTLAPARSPQCGATQCRCRSLEGEEPLEEPQIAVGYKRFEFRLPRSTSAIWVEVVGRGVYYKPGDGVDEQCVYLDLPAGQHKVVVHAENRDAEVGLQTGLTVYEYAKATLPSWYRSFRFSCGQDASRCTRAELDQWRRFQAGLTRGVLDRCGSVRVTQVAVGGARAERLDREYQELTLRFSLVVYRFAPDRPPGSAECRAPRRNR